MSQTASNSTSPEHTPKGRYIRSTRYRPFVLNRAEELRAKLGPAVACSERCPAQRELDALRVSVSMLERRIGRLERLARGA